MLVSSSSLNQDFFLIKRLNFDLIENNNIILYAYITPLNGAILYSLKLSLAVLFLLLMRGGTPRYRYDYLTKLGWLKFLNFGLLTILSLFSLILLFCCNLLFLTFDHQ